MEALVGHHLACIKAAILNIEHVYVGQCVVATTQYLVRVSYTAWCLERASSHAGMPSSMSLRWSRYRVV